ncbi:helix-turn-helix domain-containing protein [Methylobacterium goesingense]|uniref:DNA-binding transcriptional regulator YiaG n=1 Tax=Methylobacterium goesingense TaxID=243690 RepID=A0ABV2L463_9HYPH|nr:hypothetical protein [Methylobacterium goesingense]GJD72576.1 hypothetical protein CFIICLFH_0793 [Methylobacterium goesingense]
MTDDIPFRSTADSMTPEEYRETIGLLGLTQGGAAALLGVDARTSRKWANREREIPPTAARFLRYLLRAKVRPEDVIRLLANP